MRHHLLAATVVSAALLAPGIASAANYSLWVHGRNPGGGTQPGNHSYFGYWGSASTAAGVNKKAVNWDGVGRIADQNYRIRDAFDCYCTGDNWCYIAGHSAGNAQIGYALAQFGTSSRSKKDAKPNASGVCGNAGGTQNGWNIKWVDIASGAAGGSELANLGHWAVSDALTGDLRTATMRALYNHNLTRSIWFYMFAGAKGTAYSGVLPGQDDEAVAYHSTGGVSATGSFCNPGDWFCDGDLLTGTGGAYKGSTLVKLYTNHSVSLRDSNEQYNHYANGAWGGIVGPVRQDMVNYAR
ncbi:hypothetical protein [Chondromyces crocatus]|uniref:Uncharacterized protein n=1 Tax=Chondromyces crocatus TaxID=52 RepID=A0A0K1ELJ5_CHOCO|nr:hypothetical protein [Chondromyces crocatus]AKT41483.1 uncharacterized protein CMC5_056910 [Chondromyces crocatus]